jgi:NAD(P)-dependent dehydrogenase (short-subunit alcohol dehydrogenase family)
MKLENKVAIVTGAASGIGKDIAMLFAHEGAKVVIADLNQKGADAVAAELGGAKRAIGVAVDVTNETQTEICVGKTIDALADSMSLFQMPAFRSWRRLISSSSRNGSNSSPSIWTAHF